MELKRSPQGAECQCTSCGLFFSSESGFERHWTKNGHVKPTDIGLVARESPRGPVWGWPGMPAEVLELRKGSDQSGGINSEGRKALEGESAPEPPAINPEPADRALVGTRGPAGGLIAECVACGRLWERPRGRGRPSFKCGECR